MSDPAESTARNSETPERIPVGLSSCLLGEAVRHDGGHKHDRYVTGVLGRYFEFIAWCPEALAGLGVPRPPIRLTGDPAASRAVRVSDPSVDVTDALLAVAGEATPKMGTLRGYIFKRGSPSCGMERVKVYGAPGKSPRMGQGVPDSSSVPSTPGTGTPSPTSSTSSGPESSLWWCPSGSCATTFAAPPTVTWRCSTTWNRIPTISDSGTISRKHGLASREKIDDWRRMLDEWKDFPGAMAAIAWGEATARKS